MALFGKMPSSLNLNSSGLGLISGAPPTYNATNSGTGLANRDRVTYKRIVAKWDLDRLSSATASCEPLPGQVRDDGIVEFKQSCCCVLLQMFYLRCPGDRSDHGR